MRLLLLCSVLTALPSVSKSVVDPENVTVRNKDPLSGGSFAIWLWDWLGINKDTGEISTKGSVNMGSPRVQEKVYTAGVITTDAGGRCCTATVPVTPVATNDFAPRLSPLSGSVCKTGGSFSSGLVLTAVDEDLPPNAEPFSFGIPEEMSLTKWTLTQVNGTHAVLQPGVDVQSGAYQATVMVSDSGTPTLTSSARVNVTLCECDSSGGCLDSDLGVGLTIITAILLLILPALIVRLAVTTCGKPKEDESPAILVKFTRHDVETLAVSLEAPNASPDMLT